MCYFSNLLNKYFAEDILIFQPYLKFCACLPELDDKDKRKKIIFINHDRGDHWNLYVATPESFTIIFYCSLNRKPAIEDVNFYQGFCKSFIMKENWKIESNSTSFIQKDSVSCGYVTIVNMISICCMDNAAMILDLVGVKACLKEVFNSNIQKMSVENIITILGFTSLANSAHIRKAGKDFEPKNPDRKEIYDGEGYMEKLLSYESYSQKESND